MTFDMPSVYVTGPEGIAAISNRRIIQPGDVLDDRVFLIGEGFNLYNEANLSGYSGDLTGAVLRLVSQMYA